MCRWDGHRVSRATVLRLLRDEGLLPEANYQREHRQLAARREAAFASEPSGPNQVWQLDFSEFGTTGRRTSWAGTSHRPPTSTTRSPRSGSRSRRPSV
ncbi:hypothetical protein ACFVT9_07585 [Kitasatospora cineracea]|uniref:hypothetical protein n=1 Tax=Kitasatospora cineracea TaxID=88074 RepID=UPI0036DC6B72